MRDRVLTINVSGLWNKKGWNDSNISELASSLSITILNQLSKSKHFDIEDDYEIGDILEELTLLDGGLDEFDEWWCQVYDWADYNRVEIITRK